MSFTSQQLNQFGWDEWFDTKAKETGLTEHSFARVVAVDRDQLAVIDETGEFRAKLSGRFLYLNEQTSDFPCVGDWVCIQHSSSDTTGVIHAVIPRKSFLRRKAAGNNIEFQMIAANIDIALIVQSCHFDFNINRLERCLVMVKDGHVLPMILLTKTDLVSPAIIGQLIEKIKEANINTDVIALSNVTGEGISKVREILSSGKTYCLIGSSGVGKSTLINQLSEPGCAVLNAIEEGSLQKSHYKNFLKLRSESEFHEMSYLEKRKKDKAFGRYIKSAKKDMRITRK